MIAGTLHTLNRFLACLTTVAYCSNQYFFQENQLYKRRGVLCTVLNHKMSFTAVEFETGFLRFMISRHKC
jgi:hypothetical protein